MTIKFRLSNLFSEDENEKVLEIIEKTIQRNVEIRDENSRRLQKDLVPIKEISTTQIVKNLEKENLTYRRQNMLEDIRRFDAVFRAKTNETREKANKWFENVYEKFRKEKGYTSEQMTEIWKKTVEQSYDTIEEAELGKELWELYEKEF